MSKPDYRARWMSAFEDACLAGGVPHETIHGVKHEEFWNSAMFYYTQRMSAENAAERYIKVRVLPPHDLDSLKAGHDARRNAMLAEPKNPQ